MKMYFKLAFTNIINNRRLYVPNILTGTGLVAVFYIMLGLSLDERLEKVKGGRFLPTIMAMGVIVVGLISIILLLYTNGFLMKQRLSEFGLYNVLGMEKKHIGRILMCETLMAALVAMTGGIIFGIILYKLCALIICRILKVESVLGFYHISGKLILITFVVFTVLYILLYIFNRIRIAFLKPVQLLQSSHEGEREPKTRWIIAIIGFITLGTGYYLALSVKEPLAALELFFVAVILVIIGTYCLFTAGSIAILKILRKNKKFYYSSKNMIGISGMLYRMKRNAAGLASVAIMATCVLVMMSSTVSLYAGIEDMLRKEYPYHVKLSAAYYVDSEEGSDDDPGRIERIERRNIPMDTVMPFIEDASAQTGLKVSALMKNRYLMVAFLLDNGVLLCHDNNDIYNGLVECFFITAQDYKDITGHEAGLQDDAVLVYPLSGNRSVFRDELNIEGKTYRITGQLDDFPVRMTGYSMVDCLGVVLPDEESLQYIYELQEKAYGRSASEIDEFIYLNFEDEELAEQKSELFSRSIQDRLMEYVDQQKNAKKGYGYYTLYDSVWEARANEYGLLGTLMFLGIILSVVFMMATALVIYYKQVSEGYDDRERFHIMQKVGMSGDEVKQAIRGQVLIVFFLPVIVAVIHMAAASPMILRLMRVILFPETSLFVICLAVALALFCAVYVVIYIMTAKMYYHIVRLER